MGSLAGQSASFRGKTMKTSIEDGVIVFLLVFICLLAGRILASEKGKETEQPSKPVLEASGARGKASPSVPWMRKAGTIAEVDGVRYELDETLTNWVNLTEMQERRERARRKAERDQPMRWDNLPAGMTSFGIWANSTNCLVKSLVFWPPKNVVFAFPHKPSNPEFTNGVWVIRFQP